MKRAKKLSALLLCVALLAITLASCAPPAANSPAAGGAASGSKAAAGGEAATGEKILRLAQTTEPETLDPQKVNSAPAHLVCNHIFEPLLRSFGGAVEPGAAETYDVSEDGMTYTFHLRDGLVWSDGQPLTAGDYEYGFKRLMDPEVASGYSFMGMLLKNGSAVNSGEMALDELGVKALDEKTLEVTLENPAAYFPSMLNISSFSPSRKDIVEKYGIDYANSAENNVYSGPFVLKEWRKNDRVVLAKNESYWNKDTIKLDGAEIITVPDSNTALAMFETGDVDLAEIPVTVASQYPEVQYFFSGGNDYIKMNLREGYLTANKNLRLALEFALNRDDYITLATSDVYSPNTRFVLPMVNGVEGEYGTEYPLEAFPPKGDVEKGKKYLDDALKELGLTDPAEIELELLCADTDTSRIECEVLQNQWQTNLGIKVNIRQVSYKQRLEMEANGEFEMVSTGWMPDYPDPYSYLELWTTESPYNHGKYSNPAYDEAIAKSITETDPKARMDLLFEAEQIFLEDGVVVPMQLRRIPFLQNPNVDGVIHYFVGVTHNFVNADITA